MTVFAENSQPKPRRREFSYRYLLDAGDQAGVRADLTTFFGPRADVYLNTYQKIWLGAGTGHTSPRTWSWPVFLGSFTWFFYRKIYAYGAIVIFIPVLFSYLFGTVGGSSFLIFATDAKVWYVKYALERIAKADKLGLTGAERTDYLQRAGGVSLTAGIFAGLIYACIWAVVLLAIITRHHAHHQ
jgi:hypothetical protein